MTALSAQTQLIYPTSDGEPVAETYAHLYALLTTLEVLHCLLSSGQWRQAADSR